MSGIDDCASQEIEVSTSSNSTRNSKDFSFLRSVLNTNKCHDLRGAGKESTVFGDGDTKLLELEKREFVKNWILAHESAATSPQRSCPLSPVPSTTANNSIAKRTANSRIIDYQWKRVRRDIDAKENCGVSPIGRSRQILRAAATARTVVVIEDEEPRDRESEVSINTSNNDSDKTCINSPFENGNSPSSTLNASGSSCKFLGAGASNERPSSIPESSRMPETSSLSSPIGVVCVDRADIDHGSMRYSRRDTKNSGRKEAARSFWIAADESPTKLAAKSSARRSHDDKMMREKLSSFSPFRGSVNTADDMRIEKQNRSPRRFSWDGAKNSPTRQESGSTAKNNNLKRPIRQSSTLSNAISASSAIGGSDCIDVESSTTNPVEDEIQIESDSDSDATASDFIEDIETQSQRAVAMNKIICDIEDASQVSVERGSKRAREASRDSDETYYSDGDRATRLRSSAPSSSKNSQRISEDKSDVVISQAISPLMDNFETSAYALFNKSKEDSKKKKAKKGSLAAKLQALVSLQASNLRIWRHQMSQPDFKGSRVQFVTVKIRERETRWGRHYITATVIADSHYLLKSLCQGNSTSQIKASSLERRTVTLMITPPITGKVIIRSDSTLNIYPPWDVMDRDGKVLNVMYFNVIANLANVDAGGTLETRTCERVIQKFDCPCIYANAIVDSCPDKFTDIKPSVMRALFDS